MTASIAPLRPGPAPLQRWQQTWRLLLVLAFSVLTWILTVNELPSDVHRLLRVWLFTADPIIGVCSIVLVLFRRRYPVAVAAITTAASAVSTTASGAGLLAMCSLATRRRYAETLSVAVGFVVAGVVISVLYPTLDVQSDGPGQYWFTAGFMVVAVMAIVAVGFAVGARREELWSLQQRTEIAEREQVARAAEARILERHRIAREMHDVLAHRISLVAMQAGALSYRPDLSAEQVGAIAKTIADNSRQALEELRDVLGVLRADELHATDPPEPPQPSLAALPTLVADARISGLNVTLTDSTASEPPTKSARTAYRIVQEGLTNVGKHAPGATVWVGIEGAEGQELTVTVLDSGTTGSAAPAPVSGYGLLGLTERAELLGGTISFGHQPEGGFRLRAILPWPASVQVS
ncbi:sensor histidine kinase [Nocardia sp. NBC_01327]|uniref:sensor histidine kinase n=1 Tax=Nocardia sp. NBC_01327 TaxID=2903593 RepID=UPI002E144395|nr:sensor histidine kinase [Nocardia sp. NBC_01327]